MKRNLVLMLFISVLLNTSYVNAETSAKSINIFDINVNTPSSSDTVKSAAKTVMNKAVMKAQIASINSKINSATITYQSSVNNLVNNILPKEQLQKYNEEASDLRNKIKSKTQIGIEIAEDGTIFLNRYLKTYASKNTFKNLTLAQKTAIKMDLKLLENVSYSYSQITEQSKILVKQIKSDPASALELKSDLTDMISKQIKLTKQVKKIKNLTKNITESASKAGTSL